MTEVLAWAAVANSSDDVEAALRLLDLPVQLASSETVSTSVDRARLLLLSGRPDDGLAVLTKAGVQRTGQGASATDSVLAVCLAATGEQNAFEWLLWAASHVPETARGWTTYLIAAAAEGRGEWEISGRAWRALVFDHGIRTDLTVPRAVAAMVEARDRSSGAAVRAWCDSHVLRGRGYMATGSGRSRLRQRAAPGSGWSWRAAAPRCWPIPLQPSMAQTRSGHRCA